VLLYDELKTRHCTFIASISTLAHGETFIGRALRPIGCWFEQSAIVITATLGDFTNSTQVALDGSPFTQSYFAPLENGSAYALAGPSELVFSNAFCSPTIG